MDNKMKDDKGSDGTLKLALASEPIYNSSLARSFKWLDQ